MEPIRTIIVDDEEMIRNGIARLVVSCGTEWEIVGMFADGKAALDYLIQTGGAVDLLITDVKMPEMDGLTLISSANAQFTFSTIMISGYDDFYYVQKAMREGAVDYLLKPIDRTLFRELMAEVGAKIKQTRFQDKKWNELQHQSNTLILSKQTQLLSYVTTTELDISQLGYWVEDFPKGHYMLLYINLDALPVKARGYTSKDWEAYFYVMENIINEIVGNRTWGNDCKGWSWRGHHSNFWTLLYLPSIEDETGLTLELAAEQLSGHIRSAIQQHTPFTVSIAYGNRIDDLYMLSEAKRQAQSLIHYRLVYGGNKSFHEAMLGGRDVDAKEDGLAQMTQPIKLAIEQANEESAVLCSKLFFEKLERMDSPNVIQRATQNLYLLIHSIAFENEIERTEGSLEEGLQTLKQASNVNQLKAEINKLIRHTIEQLRQVRLKGSMKPIEQAKAWITINLNEDLSIKKIADHVYMNPSYFCRYFKIQTGETILDYVTGLRMDKAKKLLRNANLKMQDICLQVGYHDVKYFSRLFKQLVGETPSKYREQLISK